MFALVLLLIGAYAAPSPRSEVVRSVHKQAEASTKNLQCTPVGAGDQIPPANLPIAQQFAALAGMHAFVAHNYPDSSQVAPINDILIEAADIYQRAYACVPLQEQVFLLRSAISLLDQRVRDLVASGHDFSSETVQLLTHKIDAIRALIPPENCPVCPTCSKTGSCPVSKSTPVPPPPPQTTWAHLSLGLGGGSMNFASEAKLSVFTLRLSAGPRFVLGEQGQHRVTLGFDYALHSATAWTDEGGRRLEIGSVVHQVGPFFAVGLAPHRHFELHFRLGLHVMAGKVKFIGSEELIPSPFAGGGGIAVCTAVSALCLQVHGFGGERPKSGVHATVNLDIFRLADAIRARRAASEP